MTLLFTLIYINQHYTWLDHIEPPIVFAEIYPDCFFFVTSDLRLLMGYVQLKLPLSYESKICELQDHDRQQTCPLNLMYPYWTHSCPAKIENTPEYIAISMESWW